MVRLFQWKSSGVSSCRSLLLTQWSDIHLDTVRSSQPVKGILLIHSVALGKHNTKSQVAKSQTFPWQYTQRKWQYLYDMPLLSDEAAQAKGEWPGAPSSLDLYLATLRWLLYICLITLLGKIRSDLPNEYSSPCINTLYTLKRIHKSSFMYLFFCSCPIYKGYK